MGKICFLCDYNGPVYKFFSKERYADSLVSGNVHLGTLNKYRIDEDDEQGDVGEGCQTYFSGNLAGGSNDPEFVEKARRANIGIGVGCINIKVENCASTEFLEDAYAFCTSTEYSPENMSKAIGQDYCVKIKDPRKFFEAVSKKLNSISAIRKAEMGKVIYSDRHYTGLEEPSGPIGFVKPVFPYGKQKEFRFLWHMQSVDKLESFRISCPEISKLCERIS